MERHRPHALTKFQIQALVLSNHVQWWDPDSKGKINTKTKTVTLKTKTKTKVLPWDEAVSWDLPSLIVEQSVLLIMDITSIWYNCNTIWYSL